MYGSPPAIRNPVSPFAAALISAAVVTGLSVGVIYVTVDALRKERRKRFKIVEETDEEGRPMAVLTYDSWDGFLRIYEFKQEFPDHPLGTPVERAQSWIDRFIA